MKILIADDMVENLYLLETLLKGNGYEVVSAKNGVEALEKLKKEPVDMIISDILMPKMDGYRLCSKCKSDDKLRKIPFIFYTATYTDEKSETFALSLGAEKFITKPMEPKHFMKIIKDLLKESKKGALIHPKIPAKKEAVDYLKGYDEVLVKKLEKKVLDLRKTRNVLKESEAELRKHRECLERELAERKRAEDALRESEERFRDLIENANDLLQSVDKEGKFIYVNRKWLKVLGYAKEEVKKLTLWDILRKDQIPHCMEVFKKVCGGETVDQVDTIFVSKNGKEIYVSGNVNAQFKDGKFIATRGIFRDITERKNAEKKMREFIYKVNNISPGECYLHRSSDAVYNIFTQLVLHGVPGLCISREKPEKLIKYGIPKERIILISSTPLKGFKAIENLQEISLTISDFLKKHTAPIVLLDGLAYMISRFDFKPIFKFIQEKRFKFIETGSTLLMPVNLAAFAENEGALLTSEVKLIG